jgi:UDP-N-acetylmuramate dehydrogenase
MAISVEPGVPLAPRCTLGVGGPARFLVEAATEAQVQEAHAWARARGLPLLVLGGGSNVVIADGGVDALVLRVALAGVETSHEGDAVLLTAAAGEPWDPLVARTVAEGWAGLECLSGIPGLVGATPIQNVGAYGQEVADTVVAVRALDRRDGVASWLPAAACRFGYRDSRFRSAERDRWIVLAVRFRLRPGGAPTLRYAELVRELAARGVAAPSLAQVREAVLAVRRRKSMVLDPGDPNRRSCGSFFLNPTLAPEEAERLAARAGPGLPRWPAGDGRVKVSAAWLIEAAGFVRGQRQGPVGLSSRHALALVCHDGARAADVVALARHLRDRVAERFGVRLEPEPVLWGLALD